MAASRTDPAQLDVGPGADFIGTLSIDSVYRVSDMPGPDSKTTADSFEERPGGPAANAAITFAALGGRATLWTGTGSDSPGANTALETLSRWGVTTRADDTSARSSAVIVDGTGRRLLVSSPPPPVHAGATDTFRETAAWILVASDLDAGWRRVRDRLEANSALRLVVDSGSAGPDYLDTEISRYPSIVIAGDDGFVDDDQRTRFLDELRGRGAIGFCTRGARPVLARVGDRATELPIPHVKALDTLGAGDVLHGAFMLACARGEEPLAAMAFAARVASWKVQHWGMTALATIPSAIGTGRPDGQPT